MKFGSREICDVTFKPLSRVQVGDKWFDKGEPVLYIDTAKTSELAGEATTVYATGGKGNNRLIAWEGEKVVTFNVEDALLSPIGFSVLTGAGLLTADEDNPIIVHTIVETIIGENGDIEIEIEDFGVEDTEEIDVYVKEGDADIWASVTDEVGYAVATIKATQADGTVTVDKDNPLKLIFPGIKDYAGNAARIDFYTERSEGVFEMVIDAEKFAGYYRVEASTLFREQQTGEDMPAEIVFPKVKIQSNFTLSMASSGDPSTFTFAMDAFPNALPFNKAKKALCTMQVIGSENVKKKSS